MDRPSADLPASGHASEARVRAQYEAFPYPRRDPAVEADRLWQSPLGLLPLVNHVFWGGRRRASAEFSLLDAGCGTGDSAIFLAEQLRGTPARVLGLDLSQASLAIARARAQRRGLENVRFRRGSLLDLPRLGVGPFDYIVAAGVLHHLASPEAGLAALRDVLKPDGGLGIMVYARYGRLPIYLLQDLLRFVAPPAWPLDRRLRAAKAILQRLPRDHWATLARETWTPDIAEQGDAAIVDQFLHAQDRAYTVPEIYAWWQGAGLQLARFAYPPTSDPARYAAEPPLHHLDRPGREATAELLYGRLTCHAFFAAPATVALPRLPTLDDDGAVPTWIYPDADGVLSAAVWGKAALEIHESGLAFRVALDGVSRALLQRVDGVRSQAAILDETAMASGAPRPRLATRWRALAGNLHAIALPGLNPPS